MHDSRHGLHAKSAAVDGESSARFGAQGRTATWASTHPQDMSLGKQVHQSIGAAVLGSRIDAVEYAVFDWWIVIPQIE